MSTKKMGLCYFFLKLNSTEPWNLKPETLYLTPNTLPLTPNTLYLTPFIDLLGPRNKAPELALVFQ